MTVALGLTALVVWRCSGDKPNFSTSQQDGTDSSADAAGAGDDPSADGEQNDDVLGMGSECERDTDCEISAPLCQMGVCVCPKDAVELAQDSDNCGACGNDCTLDSPNGICVGGVCMTSAQCGDMLVEETEECDPPDGASCSDNCELVVCGDGVIEGREECDDGNTNNADECSALCTLPVCGNATVEGSEGCDDGNDVDTDGCTNACTVPGCGNMQVEGAETCDPPDGKTCNAACQLIECGDSVAEGEEQCDDGNSVETDVCTSACQFRCPGGVAPTVDDRCDREGDDSNCNGMPNEGCDCITGATSTCGEVHGSLGDCATREIACVGAGVWAAAVTCESNVEEMCNDDERDENCNGEVDENCSMNDMNGGMGGMGGLDEMGGTDDMGASDDMVGMGGMSGTDG